MLESEIEDARRKLGGYVSELDRRRHEVLSAGPRRTGMIAAGALLFVSAILLVRLFRCR